MGEPKVPPEAFISEHPAVEVCVEVDPGICGFSCMIHVLRSEPRQVEIEIRGSECQQIRLLSAKMGRISLRDLFKPMTRNPVFIAAEASRCHTTCIIPPAVLKAVEAALEMALPKAVHIRFLKTGKKVTNE